jgi:hypothetical protein
MNVPAMVEKATVHIGAAILLVHLTVPARMATSWITINSLVWTLMNV